MTGKKSWVALGFLCIPVGLGAISPASPGSRNGSRDELPGRAVPSIERASPPHANRATVALDPPDLAADFDWLWEVLQAELYDSTLVARWFTEDRRLALLERARVAGDRDEVAEAVNSLLDSLHLSHLRVFTESDIEYYLFESMFETRDVAVPRVHHLGLQVEPAGAARVVRAVWDGLSASRAGLRRGDVIVAADDQPFHSVRSFASGDRAILEVVRGATTSYVAVTPTYGGINASLLQAMQNSVRRLTVDGHAVGFVHLWSGTCPEMLAAFSKIILGELGDADGIIVDLRDGWGGAWYGYLDLFFEDRSDFFEFTVERRGRRATRQAEPSDPHAWYAGPLVVLINEGTRSGKEALAFQFKKSRRGVLVGTTTAGAFAGGTCRFRDGFAVYVPYNGPILLDGQSLEGIGVAPDVRIEYPIDRPSEDDPQLEGAIREMRALFGR